MGKFGSKADLRNALIPPRKTEVEVVPVVDLSKVIFTLGGERKTGDTLYRLMVVGVWSVQRLEPRPRERTYFRGHSR